MNLPISQEATKAVPAPRMLQSRRHWIFDLDARGMGIRSQRYAMVVNDGVVETLNVEAPAAFEISDAQTILTSL